MHISEIRRCPITRRQETGGAVKALSQKIIQAQEEERTRISREIHDDLGQSLATLKMLIQASFTASIKNQRSREKSFEKIIQYLNTIIEKTRVLASGLRPSSLEVLGLRPALKGLVNDFRCNKDLRVRFSCGRLDHLVFKAEEINVYRVIQEALTNIVRHAGARHAVIAIKKIKNHLRILIRDDGQGAKCNTRRIKGPQGLGLSTMEERVRLLGGKWEFSSVKGKGTRIVLTIPVDVHKKHG